MSLTVPPFVATAQADSALLECALVTAFLENAPDLVCFKDRASRFIAVSRSTAKRHGVEVDALLGKTDADFFTDQHAKRTSADEEAIMATGVPLLSKLERTEFRDGRQRWTEVTKLPLRNESGEVVGTFGVSADVTEAQEIKEELERAQRKILEASRKGGMAEVATGVLHNVGNVLTSLNVSANVIATTLHQSKADRLEKLSGLLEEHRGDLGTFVAGDPKGRRVPDFLTSLAGHWLEERDRLLQEVASLQENIDHIKEIVMMQQAYSTMVGVVEPLDAVTLLEDAVRMNAGALARHDVRCVRAFQPVPPVLAERAKVLQVLINLIRNAKYATDEGRDQDRTITLRIEAGMPGRVRLTVEDNGIGIPRENLAKIFTHGFTTRAGGHGFGLHSSALVAQEMNGRLTAHSEGPGLGAVFTLELPAASSEPRA